MKTLTYVEGNLLTHPEVQVIGHQANCQNTFGSGIAKTIREMYPTAWLADCDAARNKQNVLGNFSKADLSLVNGVKNFRGNQIGRIYNLYGQNLGTKFKKSGGRMTDYEGLFTALQSMANELRATDEDKAMFDFSREPIVGFPYLMGSALGGGSWDIVSRLIEVAFDGYEGKVLIVKFKP